MPTEACRGQEAYNYAFVQRTTENRGDFDSACDRPVDGSIKLNGEDGPREFSVCRPHRLILTHLRSKFPDL